jgi:23S rRNA (uridine2552-2'-O)-methyltransferase
LTKEWIRQRKRDPYYRKAKAEGYRSRATFKIRQMDERLRLIRKGFRVLDLGASPGGWSQYAVQKVGTTGKVVAVDIQRMDGIEGVEFIRGDIADSEVLEKIMEISPEYELVMSDISPSISGNRTLDRGRSLALAWDVLKLSMEVLRSKGNVVVKMFQGDEILELKEEYSKYFWKVENHKPKSSLKKSIEIYIVFRGYLGRQED